MEKIGRVMILSDKGIISKSVHAVKAEHSTAQHSTSMIVVLLVLQLMGSLAYLSSQVLACVLCSSP
jgi:hypothetical protein